MDTQVCGPEPPLVHKHKRESSAHNSHRWQNMTNTQSERRCMFLNVLMFYIWYQVVTEVSVSPPEAVDGFTTLVHPWNKPTSDL